MSEIRFNRWSHQSGTGGIYQDSSGNIGIGTSTPTSVLDIQGGSIKIGNDLLTSSGVSTFTSGLNVTSGSVGIGTDNPRTKLDVRGGNWSNGDIVVGQIGNAGRINFRRGVDGGDTAYLGYDGATNNSQVALAVNSGDGTILFKTNSTEKLRIASDNTIHMGSRDAELNSTVFGKAFVNIVGRDPINTGFAATSCYLQLGGTESDINGLYPIGFGYRANTSTHVPAYIAYKTINAGSAEYGDLLFATRNVTTDTEPSERLRITSGGQVIISSVDGTFRNPSITNIQRNGLIVFPSSSNGSSDYADNHMFSISQGQGSWLDGASGTNHTSWGPLWAFNNGSTFQKRAGIHYDSASSEQFKFWSSYGDFVFKTDTGKSGDETAETCDTEAMRISYRGHVTKPSQPACKIVIDSSGTIANGSGSTDTGRTIVPFNSTAIGGFNTGNHFNTSNHTFTCPVAGRYLVISSVNVIGDNIQYIYINGSPRAAGEFRSNPTGVWEHNEISGVFNLSANDTIAAFSQMSSGASGRKWNGGAGGSYWDTLSIYLVG